MSHASISDYSVLHFRLIYLPYVFEIGSKAKLKKYHLRIDSAEVEYVQTKISTS